MMYPVKFAYLPPAWTLHDIDGLLCAKYRHAARRRR
jgi:hypothetical protein